MTQPGRRHHRSGDLFRVSIIARGGAKHSCIMCVGSELHVAPSAPQFFPFSFSTSLPDTLVRENPPGEGAGSEWRTIDIRPKPLKAAEPAC